MSKIKSKIHYYPDGDLIIIVDLRVFCVHKTVLSLASTVFKDMISNASPTPIDDQLIIEITINDESAKDFEEVLSFIYPSVYITINWDNLVEMFRLSDKFKMQVIFMSAKTFAMEKLQENPLLFLSLSEKYRLKKLFKEASKLIIDDFIEYKEEPSFQKLSNETILALYKKHHEYVLNLHHLDVEDLKRDYTPTIKCNCVTDETDKLFKRLKKIKRFETPTPSKTYKILCTISDQESKGFSCIINFFNVHLPNRFKEIFGKVESLDSERSNDNANRYLFIEMEG
ncbi:17888_t:CDS:1 [Funneliformis geosporum]|uniref:387_t:CDS:1 n=1 Tax=Funneliformis geosporum TaxID=1117311 RepID=A0A9W4SPV7_9GLOM|nr:17888_t:CDS:1 [Funneliformis geosporum]CAI2176508.1 387_t:CDS:1 [Funneliformis geosporum]